MRLPAFARHPPHIRVRLTAVLSTITVVGIVYFFGAVIVEEILRPAYDPVRATISELAVGSYGFIQTSAFLELGVSLVCVGLALWLRVRHSIYSRIGLVLVWLCGVASFIAAAFPTDLGREAIITTGGLVHQVTASVGYGLLSVAMLLLSLHFRRDEHWRPFFRWSLGLWLAGAVALILVAVTADSEVAGLSQRMMVVPLLTWVLLTAQRLREMSPVPA